VLVQVCMYSSHYDFITAAKAASLSLHVATVLIIYECGYAFYSLSMGQCLLLVMLPIIPLCNARVILRNSPRKWDRRCTVMNAAEDILLRAKGGIRFCNF
jgi:hypothetical protein